MFHSELRGCYFVSTRSLPLQNFTHVRDINPCIVPLFDIPQTLQYIKLIRRYCHPELISFRCLQTCEETHKQRMWRNSVTHCRAIEPMGQYSTGKSIILLLATWHRVEMSSCYVIGRHRVCALRWRGIRTPVDSNCR